MADFLDTGLATLLHRESTKGGANQSIEAHPGIGFNLLIFVALRCRYLSFTTQSMENSTRDVNKVIIARYNAPSFTETVYFKADCLVRNEEK